MKKFYIFLFVAMVSAIQAQVTIRITAVPANTPPNATIYLAGTVNAWDPANSAYITQPDAFGPWVITIPEGTGTVEYKFTRGSWPTVEGNSTGGFLPNRTFTFTGSPQIINVTIQSWEDLAGSGGTSTAAANVQIMDNAFYMPQLDRYRKIWIYLPPDYSTSTKNYPVLYMQDGQNLFDDATSFAGEWNVDETLNTLHALGDFGAIVIAIENGGALRLDEYSPWNNPSYGGGEGDLYMQFVAETLKPYADANFRTRPEPQFNALIGSSMGALISAYGGAKNPAAFGKIVLFSPAFWFALPELNNYISTSPNDLSNLRLYFVAGQNESTSMVDDLTAVKNSFLGKGVDASNVFTKIDSWGTHTEGYWSGEFAAAYQWLFQEESLQVNQIAISSISISQKYEGEIIVSGLAAAETFSVFDLQGQKISEIQLYNGQHKLPVQVADGVYILRSEGLNKTFRYLKH
ncbi:MAG TPA: alpha/beta hydrolase-fold protein [Flavobacterium sp.]